MRWFRRRQPQAACPQCSAMVDAAELIERQARNRESNAAWGFPLNTEPLDSAIVWKGWWGFGLPLRHDTACGLCGTTRQSRP